MKAQNNRPYTDDKYYNCYYNDQTCCDNQGNKKDLYKII